MKSYLIEIKNELFSEEFFIALIMQVPTSCSSYWVGDINEKLKISRTTKNYKSRREAIRNARQFLKNHKFNISFDKGKDKFYIKDINKIENLIKLMLI